MASQQLPTAVIFDLDGTLVQTRLASWEVFREISDTYGLGIREPDEFFALFDGNFYASLGRLCRDESHSAEVKQALIRSLGANYRPFLVPGLAGVVRRLASVSTVAVMSSNSTSVIRRILSEHDLAFCISHVFGGDVIESKESAIRQFVADATFGPGRRCEGSYDESATPTAHDPGRTVLVTDTVGDVREARAAGIRAVGVTWGMHPAPDLIEAGAEFVALWPQEILSHLLGDEASRPAEGACALPTRAEAPVPTPRRAAPAPPRDKPRAGGFAPCPCAGGHWARRCGSDCQGGCGSTGSCGGAGTCGTTAPRSERTSSQAPGPVPSGASDRATAADQASAVRSQRSTSRGRDASRQERPPSSAHDAGPQASIRLPLGLHTAQELEDAVTLICAAEPGPAGVSS